VADPVSGGVPPPPPTDPRRETRGSLAGFVVTGRAGIGLLLVLLATLQLYLVVQEAVRFWVAEPYLPFVEGAYYLAVIAGGLWLVVRLVRRGP